FPCLLRQSGAVKGVRTGAAPHVRLAYLFQGPFGGGDTGRAARTGHTGTISGMLGVVVVDLGHDLVHVPLCRVVTEQRGFQIGPGGEIHRLSDRGALTQLNRCGSHRVVDVVRVCFPGSGGVDPVLVPVRGQVLGDPGRSVVFGITVPPSVIGVVVGCEVASDPGAVQTGTDERRVGGAVGRDGDGGAV